MTILIVFEAILGTIGKGGAAVVSALVKPDESVAPPFTLAYVADYRLRKYLRLSEI